MRSSNVDGSLLLFSRSHYQKFLYGKVLSRLNGNGTDLKPEFVHNPLASPSLLCSFLRNKVIRKHESAERMAKRIFGLLSPRNRIWQAIEPVSAQKQVLQETVYHLKL